MIEKLLAQIVGISSESGGIAFVAIFILVAAYFIGKSNGKQKSEISLLKSVEKDLIESAKKMKDRAKKEAEIEEIYNKVPDNYTN